jgi:hypothetical protein
MFRTAIRIVRMFAALRTDVRELPSGADMHGGKSGWCQPPLDH